MAQQSTIHFLGGAGSVTGSNFLLESDSTKILIDCGLFQGGAEFEKSNWQPFQFDPKEIPFLINTHAHIDHVGRIPKMVREGFRGRIISTEATKAIVEPLLMDSMELLRHAAERLGLPPLYDEADIKKTMELWEGIPYHQPLALPGGFTLELFNSGHILGSAMAKFSRDGRSIAFTGDLGGGNSELLPLVESPQGLNYLVMESVYGDRTRGIDEKDHRSLLEQVIEKTAERGGTLLIPAFSMERTQDLLFEIRTLMLEKKIPSMPVFVDSPLASKITKSFLIYPQYFADVIRARVEGGENIFDFPELTFVEDAEESQKIARGAGAKVLIAGSGMSNGGRVLSHEKEILPDEKSTLLIVGYQAAGSLGRQLVDGAKTVRLGGDAIAVKCHIETIYGFSAHMDGTELLEFVNKIQDGIEEVFVVMGEPKSSSFLAQRIRDYLGVKSIVPEAGDTAVINL
jgi:metallo-beta-lactamase family protein